MGADRSQSDLRMLQPDIAHSTPVPHGRIVFVYQCDMSTCRIDGSSPAMYTPHNEARFGQAERAGQIVRAFLIVLLAGALTLSFVLLRPFLGSIILAVLLAALSNPVFHWILRLFGGLFISGSYWRGAFFAVLGLIVIGGIDSILRPFS